MKRRYQLPPLDLIQGFEAAARTLSFTKAAEELNLTQSAISRQIRALEESLGVALFERRTRALLLTVEGRRLQKTAEEVLSVLQDATNRIRADGNTRHLTVSTTAGFASLWLIPRLRRFTALHPEVDVRISASYKAADVERGQVDVAVRYTRNDAAAPGAVCLFGEEVMPVCSASLVRENARALRRLQDLEAHTLLHLDSAEGILDWDTWLVAEGLADLRPAGSLRFDNYEQIVRAALDGQGVALGIKRFVQHLVDGGQLVVPFGATMVGQRAYFVLRSPLSRGVAHVDDFIAWLRKEAATALPADAKPAAAVSSPPPAAPSAGAGRRARSAP